MNSCDENQQKSVRPPNITHDHGYCYGWYEMENPDFCVKANCLKERQAKDEEIYKLRNVVHELQKKTKECT